MLKHPARHFTETKKMAGLWIYPQCIVNINTKTLLVWGNVTYCHVTRMWELRDGRSESGKPRIGSNYKNKSCV
jgi:hypothetical protein